MKINVKVKGGVFSDPFFTIGKDLLACGKNNKIMIFGEIKKE